MLSAFSDELAKVRTKKKEFLSQMDRIIPWGEWKALIQPYYYKRERGNKPYELELMLRTFILKNLYNLSDEGIVAEVIDSRSFSKFCGVDSNSCTERKKPSTETADTWALSTAKRQSTQQIQQEDSV